MMHRRYLKAPRNIGFSATVSARALNVAGTSFRDFFDIMEQPPPELAVFPSYQCVIVGRRRMQVSSLQVIEVAA
jgi:hypothetical protein